jgi:hypothetical protein
MKKTQSFVAMLLGSVAVAILGVVLVFSIADTAFGLDNCAKDCDVPTGAASGCTANGVFPACSANCDTSGCCTGCACTKVTSKSSCYCQK